MIVSMANTRQVIRDHLAQRGPAWVASREVACELGLSWQGVARVMSQMAELEIQTTIWIGARYRPRTRLMYRYLPPPKAEYPSWMTGATTRN